MTEILIKFIILYFFNLLLDYPLQGEFLAKGKSEKQEYFDNLGNSNLGGHRVESDDEELKKIKREKRRLKI